MYDTAGGVDVGRALARMMAALPLLYFARIRPSCDDGFISDGFIFLTTVYCQIVIAMLIAAVVSFDVDVY